MKYLLEWGGFRRLYCFAMTENMKSILRRWHKVLFPEWVKRKYGFSDKEVFQAATLQELDDVYTRRLNGCDNVQEFYRSSSCVHHMKTIQVPMVFINSMDDPIVPLPLLEIVRDVALTQENILYVEQKYGGHLGFYEGGFIYPKPLTWMDRIVVDVSHALVAKFHNKDKMMDSESDLSDGDFSPNRSSALKSVKLSEKNLWNSFSPETGKYLNGYENERKHLNLNVEGSIPTTPDSSLPSTPCCLTPPNTPVMHSRRQMMLPAGLNIFPQ
jgi:hypothetical protein